MTESSSEECTGAYDCDVRVHLEGCLSGDTALSRHVPPSVVSPPEPTTGHGANERLLGAALGRVLVHFGIVNGDMGLTGPELLTAVARLLDSDSTAGGGLSQVAPEANEPPAVVPVPRCGARRSWPAPCYREPDHPGPCSWHPAFWRERPGYCGGCGRPMMTDEERLGLVEAGSGKCQSCYDLS